MSGSESETHAKSKVCVSEVFVGTYSGGVAKFEVILSANLCEPLLERTLSAGGGSGSFSVQDDKTLVSLNKIFGSVLHSAPVRSIGLCVFERNGRKSALVATGCAAGEVVLIDLLRNQLMGVFNCGIEGINDLSFTQSINQHFLLIAGGRSCGEISVWKSEDPQMRGWHHAVSLKLCRRPVLHVAFLQSGRIFFTVDEECQMMLWDLKELVDPISHRRRYDQQVSETAEAAIHRKRCSLRIQLHFNPTCLRTLPELGLVLLCHDSTIEIHNLVLNTTVSTKTPGNNRISCVNFAPKRCSKSDFFYIVFGTCAGTVLLARMSSKQGSESCIEFMEELSIESETTHRRAEKIRNVGVIALTLERLDVAALSSSKIFICRFSLSDQNKAHVLTASDFGHRVTCSCLRSLS